MPKSASQVGQVNFISLPYMLGWVCNFIPLGSSWHKRVETKMGPAKSGESHYQHIQTLPSERATEEVKGNFDKI